MTINKNKYPIGVSDFKKLIDENYIFVDKSLFIKEIIDEGAEVLLLPRPRRFGKTLNMSMLSYYFDCQLDSKDLFKDLNIAKEPTDQTQSPSDKIDDHYRQKALYGAM